MLAKDTLSLILDNALTAAQAKIDFPHGASLAVLPEAVRLTSLEPHELHRYRFRGRMATHSIADFAEYVKRHAAAAEENAPAGFVDQDNMSSIIIFNLGTIDEPGHGDDTATLALKATAAFRALTRAVGNPLSQQDLAEWLEDWQQHLTALMGEEELPLPQAINGIRRMTIDSKKSSTSEVGDFSASRSQMDAIEARSLEVLPTGFTFEAVPYDGLPPVTIVLRLSVLTGSNAPILKLRWVGEESQREAIAQDFKRVLHEQLGDGIPLTLGEFQLIK